MEASKHLRIQWSPEFPNYFCVHILERLRDQLRAFPDINLKFLYVCMLYYEKVDMISRTQRCFIMETYTRKKFPINIFFLGLKHPCLDWENGLWFPDLLYKLQRYTGLTLFFITKYRWVSLWIFADSDLFCQKRQVFKSSRYNSSVKKAITRL